MDNMDTIKPRALMNAATNKQTKINLYNTCSVKMSWVKIVFIRAKAFALTALYVSQKQQVIGFVVAEN